MKWMMCLGVVSMLVGCDPSKAELESTKSTLTSVTQERDDLKAKLAASQQELATAKADLAKAKPAAPATAAATGKAAPPDAKGGAAAPAEKAKHGHKS
jgi:peptidoglycan hydrolase CwlO-like protein